MTANDFAQAARMGDFGDLGAAVAQDRSLLKKEDNNKMPLVHVLASLGRLELVMDSLDVATLEVIWGPGWTVPHVAVQTNCVEPISELLEKNEHLFCWEDNAGDTPVHIAARHGNLDRLARARAGKPLGLLGDPARLAYRNNLLQSAVHIAAIHGSLYQIANALTPQLLVIPDIFGENPLRIAEENGSIDDLPASLVRQAKILLGTEKRSIADILEFAGLPSENFPLISK